MTEEDRINRGFQASHELRVTQEAFDGVRAHLIDQMCAMPSTEPERVLSYHRQLEALALVRKAMILTVNDGDVARAYAEAAEQAPH
jgi:hypothetical protein